MQDQSATTQIFSSGWKVLNFDITVSRQNIKRKGNFDLYCLNIPEYPLHWIFFCLWDGVLLRTGSLDWENWRVEDALIDYSIINQFEGKVLAKCCWQGWEDGMTFAFGLLVISSQMTYILCFLSVDFSLPFSFFWLNLVIGLALYEMTSHACWTFSWPSIMATDSFNSLLIHFPSGHLLQSDSFSVDVDPFMFFPFFHFPILIFFAFTPLWKVGIVNGLDVCN